MEEEKAKETLELMLMVDTPMLSVAFGGILKAMQEGREVEEDWYKEYIAVRDSYRKIDVSRLTEETGRPVVERLQPIIREYFEILEPLWQSYVSSNHQPLEVPQRLHDIAKTVYTSIEEFDQLVEDAYGLYRNGWDVHYFSFDLPQGTNRTEWFIAGKPTIIHPEKIADVLNFDRDKWRESK